MSTSNTSQPTSEPRGGAADHNAQRDRPLRAARTAFVVIGGLLLVLAAANTFFPDWLPAKEFDAWLTVGVATLTAVAMLLSVRAIERRARAEREAVGESRRRLTRAEGDFVQALRNEVVHRIELTDLIAQHHAAQATPQQDALALPELWETTHARLALYHEIATGQATRSFKNAQLAMWAGFGLLAGFVVLALVASTTAGAVVAGGLGAVSAALAGFVSKTFVRSQEAASTHLRSYFDQPLELSRYLAAERLVANGDLSQEQRGEILSALVQAMVAGPAQPAAPSPVVIASVPGQQGPA